MSIIYIVFVYTVFTGKKKSQRLMSAVNSHVCHTVVMGSDSRLLCHKNHRVFHKKKRLGCA